MHRGVEAVRGCKGPRDGGWGEEGGGMYVQRQGAREMKSAGLQDAMRGRLQEGHIVKCSKVNCTGQTVIHL